MLKNILRKREQQASTEVETQAATSGGLPTWGPPKGTQIFIRRSSKGVKKSEAPHINRQLATVLKLFTENFHLLVEQTNVYYQQHPDKLDQAADCLTLRCWTL
jgi:hypothetical protein